MIGNNSCGMHAQMAGKVEDNVYELEILTYDGVRMTVGATSPEHLERLCARDDRIGEIYRGLRDIGDRYARRHPRALSGHSPSRLRISAATNSYRKTASTSRARWSDRSARASSSSLPKSS